MNESGTVPSRRKWLWGAGAAATAMGMGAALWRYTPQNVPASAGHPVWAEQFETPAGQVLRMAEFQGKPLLLNFWATWCPPCVEELPMLNAFWQENARQGHQVVALAIDQPSSVRRFIDRQPLGFPVGLAGLAGSELGKSLGNVAGGLPFTLFFKADGSIWRQKMGQLQHEDLRTWLGAAT